ncbi:porin [Azohydromonas lata]|uniref:Porin n=1 Tax=Azohydromonas lata TaxID=45677 RepID=A0ABU5IAN8_9BURK|nr:porin [Azohydromonas lata]MDZ5456169.1 porin [Azohydromonas lata]
MSIRHHARATLATTMLLGLPALALAQTNVTVYGIVDASVRRADNAGPDGQSVTSLNDGVYVGSRFGLRGSEDLGGGMKAVFTLENGFDPSSGALGNASSSAGNGNSAAAGGRLFGREASVGLDTPLGLVTLGRQYTLAHPLSGRFQPQPNPNLDAISMFSTHHVARQDNMARYYKQFGPVGVYASYTFNEGNGRGRGVGASYTAGPLDLTAYYQEVNNAGDTVTRGIAGLGGSWLFTKDFKAFLGYMKRNDRGTGPQQENDVVSIGANYNLTPTLVLTANYAQDRQSDVNAGKRKMGYVGLDYLFSKRTDLYAEVDNNRLSGAYPLPRFMGTRDSATSVSVGLRHRF